VKIDSAIGSLCLPDLFIYSSDQFQNNLLPPYAIAVRNALKPTPTGNATAGNHLNSMCFVFGRA